MTVKFSGSGNPVDVNGTNHSFHSTLMTSQASTSGTSIDFTSIPSWVKRVTVMFNGVSTNGSSKPRLQLGTSSGIETSGYTGSSSYIANASAGSGTFSSGFDCTDVQQSGYNRRGNLIFVYFGSNLWVLSGSYSTADTAGYTCFINGNKTLSATLDRIRITTVNGTDTFNAGSINVMYE